MTILDERGHPNEGVVGAVAIVSIYYFRLGHAQVFIGSIQDDFFTDEEENELSLPGPLAAGRVDQYPGPPAGTTWSAFPSPSALLLSRTFSVISRTSVTSTDTFLADDPERKELDTMKRHRSLQDALIVQVDSYRNKGPVQHRFILLLKREGCDQI